ncbi:MAG TPA: methyltransferase [Polyangiaceae bacterium]|jgi:tRNA1Val (adenine37-N6)-methyltransferase|nr:methyltransferase [Polyangiaceae bacterium]
MATRTGGAAANSILSQSTRDTLFGGSVVLIQPTRGAGYRTNVDALLLAAFAAQSRPSPTPVAYDLGAGVGAVALALLRLGSARRVVLVEVHETAATMAQCNLDANGWADRGEVLRADAREVARSRTGAATLVVCNPPYVSPGRGRVSQSQAHARVGKLVDFVQAARQLAGRRARVCFIYPAQELTTLLSTLADEGLHPKRLRLVHGTAEAPARVALVEARAARAGGLLVMPPLVERAANGYTSEMRALLRIG